MIFAFVPKKRELLDLDNEPLKIFTFRVVNVNRVIGGLVELMDNSHPSSALSGGTEHGQSELILVHGLRATERKDNSAFLDL